MRLTKFLKLRENFPVFVTYGTGDAALNQNENDQWILWNHEQLPSCVTKDAATSDVHWIQNSLELSKGSEASKSEQSALPSPSKKSAQAWFWPLKHSDSPVINPLLLKLSFHGRRRYRLNWRSWYHKCDYAGCRQSVTTSSRPFVATASCHSNRNTMISINTWDTTLFLKARSSVGPHVVLIQLCRWNLITLVSSFVIPTVTMKVPPSVCYLPTLQNWLRRQPKAF